MKRFLIALFAIALIAGAPLVAQESPEDPTVTEPQAEVEVEAEVQSDLTTDDELGTEDELGDDELPATGSELPLAGLLGLLSLVGAVALRARS